MVMLMDARQYARIASPGLFSALEKLMGSADRDMDGLGARKGCFSDPYPLLKSWSGIRTVKSSFFLSDILQ